MADTRSAKRRERSRGSRGFTGLCGRGGKVSPSSHVIVIAFVILILSGFSAPRCLATVYDSDGSEASVEACIRSAADGDIVTLPAGTFSWTSPLEITKGITLKGQTTIAGAGTSNPTITDATIIQGNTPRKGANTGIIKATMTPAQSFRLTGITFVKGSSTIMSNANGGAPYSDRGTANKFGGQARQQPTGGAGNRPSGAADAGSLGGGQGITGGNRPSGGSGNLGGANRPGGGAGAGNFGGATRPGGGAGESTRPAGGSSFGGGGSLIQFMSVGPAPNTSMRMDHCHVTAPIYYAVLLTVNGWVYGVADHNVMEVTGNSHPFFVGHKTWGNQDNGNGSWADYPWFGTEKFFFIEDNTLTRTGRRLSSVCDSFEGGRWVIRHNYLLNVIPAGHGTEGAASRGQRANEFYDNTISLQIAENGGVQRSGTSLWHDNSFIGLEPGGDIHCHLKNYRQTSAYPHPIWGIAGGTSPWDVNDTEGKGTYVEGHPPFLFASGSATSETTFSREQATFSDSTKNWTPNQWAGYSIKATNTNSICYGLGSYIISNTSNTITYRSYNGPDVKFHLIFNNGDAYEIHRVLIQLDQNGRGKGDLITGPGQPINRGKGDQTTAPRQPINRGKGNQITASRQPINRGKGMGARKPPINARTGTSSWPQQALEPCYSWNNVYTPNGNALGFGAGRGQPTTKLNVDFFNLGAGFPVDSTPSQVSSRYKAALNGVDYTGTFVYPHPLVTAAPAPTPTGTPGSQQPLEKKGRKKKLKEEKVAKQVGK